MNRILNWKWALLAPIAGLLLTLSFAPYDYAFASIFSLMYLYRVWSIYPLKYSVILAYLFGLGLFGSGIWWVYISVHDYGGADITSAGLLTLLLVSIWAIFPALTAVIAVPFLKSTSVWIRITSIAVLWVAVEYFRGYWLLNGFPWLQIAYSQLDTPLAGFAPVLGVYGVGFFLAASAFVLVEMLTSQLAVRQGILFLLLCWGGGGILKTVAWTHSIGAPIKITLVQGNVSQEQKWLPDQQINTLKRYQELTEQHWQDSNVIIWPETAIPAFYTQVKNFFLEPLAAIAHQHNVDVVVSLPSSGEDNEYFNSVLVLDNLDQFYHKNHLLPFGEYLPLQPLSGWILNLVNIPLGSFTAGEDRQMLLRAGGYPFITTICYEDAFGEQVTRQLTDAAYIVNVTNDAWFGDSSQAYQHMQMAQMRALESGRYLVRATNTGVTGFVAPNGSILKQAPLFTATTLTDSIVPMTGLTPYARFGDNAVFALLIAVVLIINLCASNKWQKVLQRA
ncbi:apolipoprotein N-acyltransferase [Methylomonas sp. AM2-LC]|uniref:apolipoprotein N-acyltransferase n=1 Tax=Methylomonas sp. AM2-LC TaxID=3153301 RepID=UPI0032652561